MSNAAPEVSAESVTPTSAGEATVTRHGGEPDAETKATSFVPVFCRCCGALQKTLVDGCCWNCTNGRCDVCDAEAA